MATIHIFDIFTHIFEIIKLGELGVHIVEHALFITAMLLLAYGLYKLKSVLYIFDTKKS